MNIINKCKWGIFAMHRPWQDIVQNDTYIRTYVILAVGPGPPLLPSNTGASHQLTSSWVKHELTLTFPLCPTRYTFRFLVSVHSTSAIDLYKNVYIYICDYKMAQPYKRGTSTYISDTVYDVYIYVCMCSYPYSVTSVIMCDHQYTYMVMLYVYL